MQTSLASSFRFAMAWPLVVASAIGCSNAASSAESNELQSAARLATVESSLTSACRVETIGLPCDPDGAGNATECEGLCWADDDAAVSCVPVAAANLVETDLNGRICGDEQGRDCSRSCENGEVRRKECSPWYSVPTQAQHDDVRRGVHVGGGEPVCDEVSVCDEVGISDDGCTLTACNFDAFEEGCVTLELTNPVCEASQDESDVGTGASVDAGSATDIDAGGSTSAVVDAGVITTDDNSTSRGTGAAATSSASTPTTTSAVDAGAIRDGGTPVRTPVRVVGGACNVTPSSGLTDVRGTCLGLLGLALLLARRGRQINSQARPSAP